MSRVEEFSSLPPRGRKTRPRPVRLAAMEARSVDAMPRGEDGSTSRNGMAFVVCCPATAARSTSVQVRRGSRPLFSRTGRGRAGVESDAFLLDGEIVVPHGKSVFVRRPAAADSSRREPGQETVAGNAGTVSRFRSAGDRNRQEARRIAFARAPPRAGSLCESPVQVPPDIPPVAGHHELCHRAEMAEAIRRRFGRRDRQAPRPALSGRQPRRHAEDQEIPQRRLRGRRLPLCDNKIANRKVVGSLLLGLYDDEGLLHHVGFTSAIKQADKPALTSKLEPLIAPPGFTGNAPGGPSRWSTERSAKWCPLKPKLVIEVCYDHFSGERFRHGTSILRWRPDKAPRQCSFDQLRQKAADPMKLLK